MRRRIRVTNISRYIRRYRWHGRGLESAGHRCVGHIEWDKHARKSYEAIFDTTGEWTAHDVTQVRPDELPRADIWTFGFPCQDLSVAGRQLGFSGNRSSLFFTVVDLIRGTEERNRPEWLIAENVMGLLSSNRGYDFLAAQIALDEVGYDVEWDCFDARDVGIPQRRPRVVLVGHSRRYGRRTVFPLGADATDYEPTFGDQVIYHYHSKDCSMREFHGVAPTLSAYMGTGGNNVPIVRHGDRYRKLTPHETWKLMGRDKSECDAARNAGVSDTQLYKQAGNSLIPQIVEAVGHRIAALSTSQLYQRTVDEI